MKKLAFGLMRLPQLDENDATSVDIERVKGMVDTFMNQGFLQSSDSALSTGHTPIISPCSPGFSPSLQEYLQAGISKRARHPNVCIKAVFPFSHFWEQTLFSSILYTNPLSTGFTILSR